MRRHPHSPALRIHVLRKHANEESLRETAVPRGNAQQLLSRSPDRRNAFGVDNASHRLSNSGKDVDVMMSVEMRELDPRLTSLRDLR